MLAVVVWFIELETICALSVFFFIFLAAAQVDIFELELVPLFDLFSVCVFIFVIIGFIFVQILRAHLDLEISCVWIEHQLLVVNEFFCGC